MVPKATDTTETRFQHEYLNERSVNDGKNVDSFSPLLRQVSNVYDLIISHTFVKFFATLLCRIQYYLILLVCSINANKVWS